MSDLHAVITVHGKAFVLMTVCEFTENLSTWHFQVTTERCAACPCTGGRAGTTCSTAGQATPAHWIPYRHDWILTGPARSHLCRSSAGMIRGKPKATVPAKEDGIVTLRSEVVF
jgi:hypothetical protein